jgi:hypothetical protein
MSGVCTVCRSGRVDEVDALQAQGVSIAKTAKATGFSIQNIRTHKKHADIPTPVSTRTRERVGDYSTEIEEQAGRLKAMLSEIPQKDIANRIKLESEYQKTLRALRDISEQNVLDEALNEKRAISAQIRSLSAVLLKATRGCPECQNAIRSAIQQYTESEAT